VGSGEVSQLGWVRHLELTYRFDEIRAKITPFLKSLGFNPKTDLTFIPVSAQMGQNMKDPVDKKIASWYE
jgi:peptide chain release factor subunit 3